MACDGHYRSDLPVFYKIMSYLDTRWERCSCLVCDVLDTYLSCPSSTRVFDLTLQIMFSLPSVTFHDHLQSVCLTICPSSVVLLPSCSNWSTYGRCPTWFVLVAALWLVVIVTTKSSSKQLQNWWDIVWCKSAEGEQSGLQEDKFVRWWAICKNKQNMIIYPDFWMHK